MSFTTPQAVNRKKWRCVLLAVLVLVLLAVLANAWLLGKDLYTLWTRGMRLRTLARDPTDLFQEGHLARTRTDLGDIERALLGLRAHLQPVLRATWYPWRAAREHLQAGDEGLGMGAELARVGQTICEGIAPIVEAVGPGEGSRGASEALFAGLVAGRPRFEEAERRVIRLGEDAAALAKVDLWSPVDGALSVLADYLRLGRSALAAATAAPLLLGELETAQYLILAQNSEELRPTGGFITSIGRLVLEQGAINELTVEDSYAVDKFTVDHPFAPEPMQRHMGVILWTTRDGNWSPDFPTAARDVEDLYYLENPDHVDGVIAFDMWFLGAIVDAVEPLDLEGYDELITGDNVFEKMQEYWLVELPEESAGWSGFEKRDWLRGHRKDFFGPLSRALMRNVQKQSDPRQLGDLLSVVQQALNQKHLQLYFHAAPAQEFLTVAGWDGALDHTHSGDYLLVLDTNMGYNKVNVNITQEIDYEVTLGRDDGPQATLTITYHNRSPWRPTCERIVALTRTYEMRTQDCYMNYLRVYVPPGSELVASGGFTETATVADEEGKTVFATFFVVPTAETRTVRFVYNLPLNSTEEYRLLVQKQAGTDAVPLTVRIALPVGTRVLTAEPEPSSRQQRVVSYDWNLRRDRSFALRLR